MPFTNKPVADVLAKRRACTPAQIAAAERETIIIKAAMAWQTHTPRLSLSQFLVVVRAEHGNEIAVEVAQTIREVYADGEQDA